MTGFYLDRIDHGVLNPDEIYFCRRFAFAPHPKITFLTHFVC